jgi:hypothetical protein
MAIVAAGETSQSITDIVYKDMALSESRLLAKKHKRDIKRAYRGLKTLTRPYRPLKRWYEDKPPPGRAHRGGSDWRDATDHLRLQLAHYAMLGANLEGSTLYAMTLRLGAELEASLHGKIDAKRRLSKRFNLQLGDIQYWFVLEGDAALNIPVHLHGEIACDPDKLPHIRRALKKAGGAWGSSKHQLKLDPEPDDGWVSYALKNPRLFDKRLRNHLSLPYLADPIMITHGLKRDAQALYELARAEVSLPGFSIRSLQPKTTPRGKAKRPTRPRSTEKAARPL